MFTWFLSVYSFLMKEVDYLWYLHLSASFSFFSFSLMFAQKGSWHLMKEVELFPNSLPFYKLDGSKADFMLHLSVNSNKDKRWRVQITLKYKTWIIKVIIHWNLIIESFVLTFSKISFQLQVLDFVVMVE